MLTLKLIHITLAMISIGGFVGRAWAMFFKPELLKLRLTRKLPHVIDTLLLASGVTMAWYFGFNPVHQPWLACKLGLLLLYIVLGAFGLRYAATRQARTLCCLGALLSVCTIVYLAHYKPLLYGA